MKIYVDADASPVKDTIISIAEEAHIPVVLVQSFSHFSQMEYPDHVEVIYVDHGVDSADFRIVRLAQEGDIVITQDYGLASLCLGKKCIVLHHKGFAYTNQNIDRLLHSRYTSAMARKAGQRTKGPKPFTTEDKEKFADFFRRILKQEKS